MSTTSPAQPEQDTAGPGASSARSGTDAPPALRQDTRGRPQNFGLDVKRLRLVRAIVFAVLALPILLLGLLAIKFVSMPITQSMHHSAYQDGDYATAIERLAPVQVANWFEPYLPHLSEGTDLLQQGENAAAEEELTIALQKWEGASDLNQPLHAMCKIRNNLAISIERQADEIEDPAQRAERLYEAETIIAPCASGGGGGDGDGEGSGEGEGEGEGQDEGGGEEQGEDSEGTGNEDQETTDGNDERIEEKRREADEEAGNDPDAREDGEDEGGEGDEEGGDSPRDPGDPTRTDPDGEEPPQETPTSGEDPNQEKEDELEQRNREAQEGGEGEGDPSGSDQDPSRPW